MNGSAIAVGVDGSAEALHAVRWAADAAVLRHAPLRLVHGCAPLSGWYGGGLPVPPHVRDALAGAADEMLASAERAARDAGGPDLSVTTRRVTARAAPALLECSRTARVVVLGGAGAGGFTAVQVAAHAHCPVVVVRGGDHQADANGPVVVGVDGSPVSEHALTAAFEEASWRGCALVAVHAWSDGDIGRYPSMVPIALDWDELVADEERLLAEQLAGRREEHPDVRVDPIVVRDKPRHLLLDWTRRARLVVVGSRGRGGFTGLLLGSTSQALIHHARCPVMIARRG